MFKFLLFQKQKNLAFIKMNRPEVFNALNEGLCIELQKAFEMAGSDPEVRAVVFTGEGKGFCSGLDLKDIEGKSNIIPSETIRKDYNPLILAMRKMNKPIIGLVNGVAAGAGFSLALACDYLIVADSTLFSQAFVLIGLVPDSGSSFFLPRLVGEKKAFELAALGDKISAPEALQLGIINKIVPQEELEMKGLEIAERFASGATVSIGLIKKMISESYQLSLEETLSSEADYQDIAGSTQDFKEGLKAFKEKRKPEFKGC